MNQTKYAHAIKSCSKCAKKISMHLLSGLAVNSHCLPAQQKNGKY